MFDSDWMMRLQNSFSKMQVIYRGKTATITEICLGIEEQLNAHPTAGFHLFGNGGSNAICSHISQDILNKLSRQSSAYDSSPLVTCQANDYGYENAFLNIAKVCIKQSDICLVVSSSGNSINLLNLLNYLNNKNIYAISITGFSESNKINFLTNTTIKIYTPTTQGDYGVTECLHQIILHIILDKLATTINDTKAYP
jgi:D-sedoheptulose 7-phosphate isomerase